MKEIEQTSKEATHLLQCRHCVGTNRCRDYSMKCIPLGKTKSGKIKIIVFGDMGWKDKEHIKKIRYVDEDRIRKFNFISDILKEMKLSKMNYPICKYCNQEVLSPLNITEHFSCVELNKASKLLDLDVKDITILKEIK